MSSEPRFDVVFKQFYDNEPDQVRGLVAYGLYKIAKREWTEAFHGHHVRPPDRTDIDAYTSTWTPSMVAGKQAEADSILRDYGSTIIAAEKPRIVEEALRGSTPRAVAVNVFSGFIYTLLLIGLVIVLHYAGVGLPAWL